MLKIKKLPLIVLAAVLMSAGFLFASTVSAQVPQNLVVIFSPNPLFGAVNFLPGQSATAQIEIKNQSGESKPVAIEAINVNDPNHFGDALNLKIKEGTQTILNKSLTEFFGQGETFLSNLADNASTTYDLIVTFNASAGNYYQNKVLNNFDILFGFQGEQTPVTPPGSGGGGGGGGVPAGLTIFNEVSINVSDNSATITWQTNYFSTSRVIYGTVAGVFNFNNPPNYGYNFSTIDDLSKVTFHSVPLTGLTPGTTYYYRVISHASPDTVSVDHSFTTSGQSPGGEPGNQGGQSGGPINENPTTNVVAINNPMVIPAGQVAGIKITAPAGNETGANQNTPAVGEQNGAVAGAQNTCRPWPWVKIIILAIIYILLLLINYADKIKKDIREKYGSYFNWLFAVLPIIIAALAIIFCGILAWWLWVLLIIFYLILIIFYFIHLDSPIYWRVSALITLYLAVIIWIVINCLC